MKKDECEKDIYHWLRYNGVYDSDKLVDLVNMKSKCTNFLYICKPLIEEIIKKYEK